MRLLPPRAWGAAAGFCWVVSLLLLVVPMNVQLRDGTLRCGRSVSAALGAGEACADRGRDRLATVSGLVVLAAATSTAYLAGLVKAGRDTGG